MLNLVVISACFQELQCHHSLLSTFFLDRISVLLFTASQCIASEMSGLIDSMTRSHPLSVHWHSSRCFSFIDIQATALLYVPARGGSRGGGKGGPCPPPSFRTEQARNAEICHAFSARSYYLYMNRCFMSCIQ